MIGDQASTRQHLNPAGIAKGCIVIYSGSEGLGLYIDRVAKKLDVARGKDENISRDGGVRGREARNGDIGRKKHATRTNTYRMRNARFT